MEHSLAKISSDLLHGSLSWRVWCIVCSVLGLAIVAAFVVIADASSNQRVLFLAVYFLLMVSVVWLSVVTRDVRKKDLFKEHGSHHPQLRSHAESVGNTVVRRVSAWVGFAGALIFFGVALGLAEFDGSTVLNCCETALIVVMVVFQQAKVSHDISDSNFLGRLLGQPPAGVVQQPAPMQVIAGEGEANV